MFAWIADNIANIVISLILALIVGLTIRKMILDKKSGKSSCGCDCGSCGVCCTKQSDSSNEIKTNLKDYPYSVDLKISGIKCQACARKIETSLNSLEGVLAGVEMNTNTAHIITKQLPDIQLLCDTVAKSGYTAEPK